MAHRFLCTAEQPAAEIQSRCGPLTILTSADDSPHVSIAHLEAVEPGTLHFHREATEIYVIQEGYGFIRVDDIVQSVAPGDRIIIYPGAPHQVFPLFPDRPLVITVITAPAWREDDEITADITRVVEPTGVERQRLETQALATAWPRPTDDW